MTRRTVTGIAVFLAGLTAGVFVTQPLLRPAGPEQIATGVPSRPPSPVPAAMSVVPAGEVQRPPVAAELPSSDETKAEQGPADVVIVPRSVGQDAAAAPQRTVKAPDGTEASPRVDPDHFDHGPIRMAEPSAVQSALRSNPVVIRELTREIQQELYRAGCHSVTISGDWDARTAKATATIAANRNAVLPTDKPDVILLSLLRGYRGDTCGRSRSAAIASQPHLATTPDLAARPAVIAPQQPASRPSPAPGSVPRRSAGRKSPGGAAAAGRPQNHLSWRRQIFTGIGTN